MNWLSPFPSNGSGGAPSLVLAVVLSLQVVLCFATQRNAQELSGDAFACGGKVEGDVWRLWDLQGRAYLGQQLLRERLINKGDTYALYDLQTYAQSLVSMAQRCGRTDRLLAMADDWMVVYSLLEPLGDSRGGSGWICKGGFVCNERNRLVNKEVMLVSAQGLGLFASLANALAKSKDGKARAHPFVARTAEVSASHLLRWGDRDALQRWQRLIRARPADVVDGSSALLFTDHALWQIAIYANLAGIYSAEPALLQGHGDAGQMEQLGGAARTLLQLFNARLTFDTVVVPGSGKAKAADLDRGYWRLYADSRYAGYAGSERPANCVTGADGKTRVQVVVAPSGVPIVPDIGWDISHARRLVVALDALRENRQAIQKSYGLMPEQMPDQGLRNAFAAQLAGRVWNGDKSAPLFSNYWSGTNGWYRVAYDNGTDSCYSGYPPFGLSDSFPTGGYAVWSEAYPVIGEIARNIYRLTQAGDSANADYVRKYLSGFGALTSANTRMLNELMFWPSLVQ